MEGWKRGPLPKDTWGYGGVVTSDMVSVEEALKGVSPRGFVFADFRGDHVRIPANNNQKVIAEEVVFYNNDLTVPVRVTEEK